MTESVLLAAAAGALGLLVVWALIRLFAVRVPDFDLVLDWPAAVFTFTLALATGIVFGLSPALHATHLAVADVLKNAAASVAAARARLQQGLVVAQITLTQPLLVGLIVVVLFALSDLRARPGTTSDDHIVSMAFHARAGNASTQEQRETMLRVQERLAALPGVIGVVPQQEGYYVRDLTIHPDDRLPGQHTAPSIRARSHFAPPGYFALMDMNIVRGRDFSADEQRRAAIAIVIGSELAHQLWGPANPVGRRLIPVAAARDTTPFMVVGVVDDTRAASSVLDNEMDNSVRIYVSHFPWTATLLVRTRGPAEPVIPLLRSTVRAEAPQLPIREVRTLANIEAERRSLVLRISGAGAAGGLLALFLSAIGLYAVIASAIGQRTREIGVRTALGALPSQLAGLFLWRGLRLNLLGLLAGLPLGLLAIHQLTRAINLRTPSTLLLSLSTAAFVLCIGFLATWLPARRAAHIDPLSALRAD